MTEGVRKFIDVSKIRLDGSTQPRCEISEDTVADYAEAMRDGANFPPVVVFNDGSARWLADGFHRFHATRAASLPTILVEEHAGSRRDAVLFGFQANIKHGLRETRADKRRKIEAMLRDREWVRWSDREIARKCGVDHKTVSALRAELVAGGEIPHHEARVGADGVMQPSAKTKPASDRGGEIPHHSNTASAEIQQIDARTELVGRSEIPNVDTRTDDEATPEQSVTAKPAVDVTIAPPAQAAEAPAQVVFKPATGAEVERLRAENAELREQLAELASNLEEAIEEIEVLHRVTEADDQIKAALAEARRVTEHNRVLEERIRGLTGESAEAIKLAKSWKRKAQAAERLLKAKG
ncbi:hypothetical protein GO613_00440 [Azoarcus communis]|uniref:hypothetical protein n=1 Tax=Parazoarcus communis TaxID=41977 RepID=UPI001459E19E|nr:hypothetical protein [Parazoarcus communis]NMG46577.1 hypothetical protein [Parazoarcus communis]